MGVSVDTWISIGSFLVGVIALIPRERLQRTPDQENTLLAVSEAYYETATYLSYRESHDRDGERELKIAFKWDRAAILLGKYDQALAKRLGVKSRFWREGGTWDPKAVENANIGLESVKREVDERLRQDS